MLCSISTLLQFVNLRHLKLIDFEFLKFKDTPSSSKAMPNVESLELILNSYKRYSTKVSFSRFINLKRLEISFLKEHIELNPFFHTQNLSVLKLHGIAEWNLKDVHLNLKVLELDFIRYSCSPNLNLKIFPNLKYLKISGKVRFNLIEPGLVKLKHLETLILRYLSIEEINLSNLVNLKYLDLSHNPRLVVNKHTFSRLTQLEELYLSNSNICTICLAFANLKRLRVLNLSENCLIWFHKKFRGLTELRDLDLSDNYIINYDLTQVLNELLPNLERFRINHPPKYFILERYGCLQRFLIKSTLPILLFLLILAIFLFQPYIPVFIHFLTDLIFASFFYKLLFTFLFLSFYDFSRNLPISIDW